LTVNVKSQLEIDRIPRSILRGDRASMLDNVDNVSMNFERIPAVQRSFDVFKSCVMRSCAHLSTWIAAEAKQRFSAAASHLGLSESALLRRLVLQLLATATEVPAPLFAPDRAREARITVRLIPEDCVLLRERAAARAMPASTYVSVLVRAHLRRLAPLPDRELAALKATTAELAALGRNLNTTACLLRGPDQESGPTREDLFAIVRACEALRDHTRGLVKANLVSWQQGHTDELR
jgi:hypothetical protein